MNARNVNIALGTIVTGLVGMFLMLVIEPLCSKMEELIVFVILPPIVAGIMTYSLLALQCNMGKKKNY